MKLTNILTALAATTLVSAAAPPPPAETSAIVAAADKNGCYSDGQKFNDMRRTAVRYAGDFCAGPGDNGFGAGQTAYQCRDFPNGHRVDFYLHRAASTPSKLHRDTCNKFFQGVINGCGRGGTGTQDGWYFR